MNSSRQVLLVPYDKGSYHLFMMPFNIQVLAPFNKEPIEEP